MNEEGGLAIYSYNSDLRISNQTFINITVPLDLNALGGAIFF
jgi:hypothetical protein